ncbi:MAG: fimbria/pilus outer membrane usher protein [Gammaproteobacteria bacterium]
MTCRLRRNGALWLLLLWAVPATADPVLQPLIVDLTVNGESASETLVLRDDEGTFFVGEEILAQRGIAMPWPDPVEWRGGRYYPLTDFAGTLSRLDTQRMALRVEFSPALMPLRRVGLARAAEAPWTSGLGAFLDYDLNVLGDSRSSRPAAIGSFRPVVFGEFGHVSLNSLYRIDQPRDGVGTNTERSGLTVLDLTYTRDDPDALRSFRFGDIIAVGSSDGRALRLGGIQLATNFETRPELVTYPLPTFYGETAVPTALDVYVNGRLTGTEEIRPGSYVLEDIPVVNGDGQVQVVARDALGREQVYSQDVYVSTELLRQGLSEYSVSVGAIREDYGLENFRYGDMVGSATWRYGVRDSLTVETYGEATDGVAGGGGALQSTLPVGGTLNVGLGLSASDVGSGVRWRLGYRRLSGAVNYSVDIRGMSPGFRIIGLPETALPGFQLVASASRNLYRYGSLGVSLVRQGYRSRDDRTIVSASYSKGFRNSVNLSARVSYLDAGDDDLLFGLRVSMPFGDRHSVAGAFRSGDSGEGLEAEINRSLPYGPGYGYRLAVGTLDTRYVDAGFDAQSDYGTYRFEVRDGEDSGTLWQADLPLTADIRRVEAEAVPYARSGVVVDFDVRDVQNLLLHARLPDGSAVPEGARARVEGSAESFPVGLDGLLFLPGVGDSSRLVVSWGDDACEIELPEINGAGVMTRLGEQLCRPWPENGQEPGR